MREDKLETRLKAEAARLGFAACGVARADAAPRAGERLRQWLADGSHGGMIWMETRAHHRAAPTELWPAARSVIGLGLSYAPARDPLALANEGGVGRISVYAQGSDYHDVVKRNLKTLARWLVAESPDADVKVFVDTAPVMEKPLAEAAGLGLARQAHQFGQPHRRQLAVLGGDLHDAGAGTGPAGAGWLRVVRRLPARVPQPMRFLSPIGSMRGVASHT